MEDYKVSILTKEGNVKRIDKLPELPFVIKVDDDHYMITKKAYETDVYYAIGLDNGISYGGYTKEKIIDLINNKSWKLIKANIILEV